MKNIAAVPLFRGFLIALAIAIPLALIGASASSESTKLVIAPDLAQRLAKFKKVHMPFDSSKLTDREKQMVAKLVDASGLLDCIYWRQSDPDGLKLYLSLMHTTNPQFRMLAEYLKINGGRFDLIDDNKPFVGTEPMPPGRGFFPWGMTLDKFNAYVAAHPNKQSFTVRIRWSVLRWFARLTTQSTRPNLRVSRTIVRSLNSLKPMATDLREAADLSDDPAFANFLRLRADALLTDDYYKSDIAWLDLKESEIRRDLRAVRDLSRRPAGRENFLRRVGDDPQRCRKQESSRSSRNTCPSCRNRSRLPRGRSAVEARQAIADGSCRRALSRGRSAARLSGRRR